MCPQPEAIVISVSPQNSENFVLSAETGKDGNA